MMLKRMGSYVFLMGVMAAVSCVAKAQEEDLPAVCVKYAKEPLPAEANIPTPHAAPDCASWRWYRGVGRPVDFAKARACAWRERKAEQAGLRQNPKEPLAWVVGGSLILADLYVNGEGVTRNVPLAMRFACEAEPAMAATAAPDVDDVPALKADERFEFCDDAESMFQMGFCHGYEQRVKDDRRNRFFHSLEGSMTAAQRASFETLLQAQARYVDAHASEVYQGGSIRTIRTIESQNLVSDNFRAAVTRYERHEWPALSSKQIADADARLNRQYRSTQELLRKQTKEDIQEGEVSGSALVRVEHAWLVYRDAWAAFAKLRYPGETDAIVAKETEERTELLRVIGDPDSDM